MNLGKMKRIGKYKFYIKARLDRETEEQDIYVKTKGDYFEALMFAIEAIAASCMDNLKMDKKEFLKIVGKAYDFVKGQAKNGE